MPHCHAEGGAALLQIKLQLMLSYATNIAFYLLLKAQGRAVREHPVIDGTPIMTNQ